MKESIEERLRQHPALRARVEQLLDLVENTEGQYVRADATELAVVKHLRQLGQELLQDWAEVGAARVSGAWDEQATVQRKEKKH